MAAAGTVFSCVLKSRDGGQTFSEVRLGEYSQMGERLIQDSTCVKMKVSPDGPIIDAWAARAADTQEMSDYMRSHGRYSQYSGLKPRWLAVNLRAHHVWSNFSSGVDIILAHTITCRGLDGDECAMVVGQSLGGPCVDYNLFPVAKNVNSGIVSNWSWWKSIEFVMQVWLLLVADGLVVYQVLFDYADPQHPDRPTHITYAIRFVADNEAQNHLLTACFSKLKKNRFDQPAECLQYYAYDVETQFMQKILEKLKKITWERLYLLDQVRNGLLKSAENDVMLLKNKISDKWRLARKIANEVTIKAAVYLNEGRNLPVDDVSDASEGDTGELSDDEKEGSQPQPKPVPRRLRTQAQAVQSQTSQSDPLPETHYVVINGSDFDPAQLKTEIEDFLEKYDVHVNVITAQLIGMDKNERGIIRVEFENMADKNSVMNLNTTLR